MRRTKGECDESRKSRGETKESDSDDTIKVQMKQNKNERRKV